MAWRPESAPSMGAILSPLVSSHACGRGKLKMLHEQLSGPLGHRNIPLSPPSPASLVPTPPTSATLNLAQNTWA